MTMAVTQVRLPEGLVKMMDKLVEEGTYSSKSDVVRDALRLFLIRRMVGIMPNTGDSVKEVKELRKKLSKDISSFEDFKKLLK